MNVSLKEVGGIGLLAAILIGPLIGCLFMVERRREAWIIFGMVLLNILAIMLAAYLLS